MIINFITLLKYSIERHRQRSVRSLRIIIIYLFKCHISRELLFLQSIIILFFFFTNINAIQECSFKPEGHVLIKFSSLKNTLSISVIVAILQKTTILEKIITFISTIICSFFDWLFIEKWGFVQKRPEQNLISMPL